jgi:hypothetical protein
MKKNKIKRIVIWGLKKRYHTHRHIHMAFYVNAKKLGYNTIWVEDEKKNQKYLESGDLIISAEVQGKMVPKKFRFEDYNLPIRDDIFYCLHNFKDIFKNKLKSKNYINLQVYNDSVLNMSDIKKYDEFIYFDNKTRTLYQPWGTDLLPGEFRKPVFSNNRFVFWIGSIWNDKNNHGNINEINELRTALSEEGLNLIKIRFIPDWFNVFLIRVSKIAPAIAGRHQVDVNYLPCRMFKNISYGQLGVTNVKKFKDILGDSFIEGNTIKELIKNSLKLSRNDYIAKVRAQQKVIKKYTYKDSLERIINLAHHNYEK